MAYYQYHSGVRSTQHNMNKNNLHWSSSKTRCYMGYPGIHQNLFTKKLELITPLGEDCFCIIIKQ